MTTSMTKEIPLTQGQVAIVDDADYEWLAQWKWCAHRRGDNYYATKSAGGKRIVRMHTLILNAPPYVRVRHINGNSLDYRRINLRLGRQEPRGPKVLYDSNKSGYRGVSLHKPSGKWRATINANGKQYSLRYFDTPEDAARAYDKAALELYGESARLNFPKVTT